MSDIEKRKYTQQLMLILIVSAVVGGVLAHGSAVFNKFSIHDDIGNFTIGSTYASGRWGLGWLEKLYRLIFGTHYVYSSPVFNAAVTFLLIALLAFVVIKLLDIKNTAVIIGAAEELFHFSGNRYKIGGRVQRRDTGGLYQRVRQAECV